MDQNYDPGRYVRMNEDREKIEQLEKQKKYLQDQCRKAGHRIKVLEQALDQNILDELRQKGL